MTTSSTPRAITAADLTPAMRDGLMSLRRGTAPAHMTLSALQRRGLVHLRHFAAPLRITTQGFRVVREIQASERAARLEAARDAVMDQPVHGPHRATQDGVWAVGIICPDGDEIRVLAYAPSIYAAGVQARRDYPGACVTRTKPAPHSYATAPAQVAHEAISGAMARGEDSPAAHLAMAVQTSLTSAHRRADDLAVSFARHMRAAINAYHTGEGRDTIWTHINPADTWGGEQLEAIGDDFTCPCGNAAHLTGFLPAHRDGTPAGDAGDFPADWSTHRTYACPDCGRYYPGQLA